MNDRKKVFISPSELFGNMEELLKKGYDGEFTVTGNSMWPFLAHGRDRVVLRKKAPCLGDVVLFCPTEGKYLLHRVDRIKDGKFRTSGDSCCFHDGEFPFSSVVGTSVAFYRKGKRLVSDSFFVRFWGLFWISLFPFRRQLLWLGHKLVSFRKR